MKQPTKLILIILATSFIVSCGCGDPASLINGASTFAFRIVDESTGEVIFPNRFDPWAFEIINDEGNTVDIDAESDGRPSNYGFTVSPTLDQSFRFNERTLRRYFLHFDSTDIDTLSLFYIPRADDCTEYLDDFEAYYNYRLVATGSGESYYQALAVPKQ